MVIAKVEIIGGIGDGEKDLSGRFVTLTDVERQLASYQNFDAILVQICSPGGYIDVADAIIDKLRMYKVPIYTEAFGQCSSAATLIFLIGQKRVVHRNTKFLVHPPSGRASGTADQMQLQIESMRTIENRILNEYQTRNTKNPKSLSQWKKLLKAEKVFLPQELVEIGFATEIFKPLHNMANKQIVLSASQLAQHKALKALDSTLGTNMAKMLDVATSDGTPLIIDGEAVEVGKTIAEASTGESAPDGQHTITANGITYNIVVSGGVITEVSEAGATATEDPKPEDTEALQNTLVAITEGVNTMKAKYDNQVSMMQKTIDEQQKSIEEMAKIIKEATGKAVAITATDRQTQQTQKVNGKYDYSQHTPKFTQNKDK